MNQGQGGGTLDKERKIGSAQSIGMRTVNSLARKEAWRRSKPFFHLDLNCGSGWNDIAGCPGSPVVFCELQQQLLTNVPLHACFCDSNPDFIARLERWLIHYGHLPQPGISLVCDDNKAVIGRFAEQIRRRDRPQYALGSVLCDPNQWFRRNKGNGEGVPADEVIAFAQEFFCMDIILNVNYRLYAQQRGAGHNDMLSPNDIRRALNRKHWLVSRQHLGGNNRFWLAIGRNIPTRDHKALGLYHWDSPEGQQIMNIVNGDRQGEMDLDPLPRQTAMVLPLISKKKQRAVHDREAATSADQQPDATPWQSAAG